jgi:hypothetical protein
MVGNATRLGASQRSTARRCASHHITTQRANRWGHPAALARLARTVTLKRLWLRDGHVQRALVAHSWAEYITNMPGFNLRQAQAHFGHHYSIIGRPIQSLLSQRTARSGCLSPCKRARAS